jgi:hypothetical protein
MKAINRTLWIWPFAIVAMLITNTSAQAFYDPSGQRWLNRDPIAEKGGRNLFQFVVNNPVKRSDAKGLSIVGPPPGTPPVIQPPVIQPPVILPPGAPPPVIRPPVIQPPVLRPPIIQPPVIRPPLSPKPPVKPGGGWLRWLGKCAEVLVPAACIECAATIVSYEVRCLDWADMGYDDMDACVCDFMSEMPKFQRWSCAICLESQYLWEWYFNCDDKQSKNEH